MTRTLRELILAALLAACASNAAAPAPAAAAAEAAPARPAEAARIGAAWFEEPAALAGRPDSMKIAPLDLKVPKIETTTLDNGLVVYAVEDPSLQLASASLVLAGGAIYDPADKVGLASLAAASQRTGGAGDRSADALDDALDFLAAEVGTSADQEAVHVDGAALARDFDTLLGMFADVALRPKFDEARVAIVKARFAESIRRRNETPGSIASRTFAKAVFGEKSPWAREASLDGIAKLTRADLVEWHKRVFQPEGARLVIAGPFPKAELVARAKAALGGWPKAAAKLPEVALLDRKLTRRVILVPKPFAQAQMRLGHLGYRRHDPDEYALRLLNDLLGGGGFTSRVTREIRSNRGLAYSAGSFLTSGKDRGLFGVAMGTEPAKAKEALDVALDIVTKLAAGGAIPQSELDESRDSFVNSFAFRFDTPTRAASERATLDFYGFPDDYLEAFRAKLGAVTTAAAQDAAKRYIHPDELQIVIVGDPKKLGPLDSLGPVTIVEDPEKPNLP